MAIENTFETISVNGKNLVCPHCSTTTFSVLKGRLVTLSKIKWGYEQLNRPTTCYVCSGCNYIYEFLDK